MNISTPTPTPHQQQQQRPRPHTNANSASTSTPTPSSASAAAASSSSTARTPSRVAAGTRTGTSPVFSFGSNSNLTSTFPFTSQQQPVLLTLSHQRPLSPSPSTSPARGGNTTMAAPLFPPPSSSASPFAPPMPTTSSSASSSAVPTTPLSKKRSLSLLSLTPSPSSTPTPSYRNPSSSASRDQDRDRDHTATKRARPTPSSAPPPSRPSWVTPAADAPSFANELASIEVRQGSGQGHLSELVRGGICVLVVVEGVLGHWEGVRKVRALMRGSNPSPNNGGVGNGSSTGAGGVAGNGVACFAVGLTPTPPLSSSPFPHAQIPQLPPLDAPEIPYIWDFSRRLMLRLGLLHPLGGGRTAMDAVVVFDAKGRRRMCFPVGWRGEGEVGVEEVVWRAVRGVEWLLGEVEEETEAEAEGGMEVEMG